MAAASFNANPDAVVYVPSAFQQAGARSELELYGDQLCAEGVPVDSMVLDRRGFDTVEQCELALALAAKEHARLMAISCDVHSTRVRYLLRGSSVEHLIAIGTPNRWLRFTHRVLSVTFPVLDHLGLRGWWKGRVARRRMKGKQ